MSQDYAAFVAQKLATSPPTGFEPPKANRLKGGLFPFQADLVRWALKRGRAAIFAGTGLGKTRMQLAWAHHVHKHTGRPVLVLAPLAVAQQTVAEARAVGVRASLARDQEEVKVGITVTNYDRLHRFVPDTFGAVVLDESSCIKHHDTKTLATLLGAFKTTPFKLCCTATPAPNDWVELGTHAEFLGVCTRAEMLAEFFFHDGGETQKWTLKGHARAPFWRWVAAWGALVAHPRDLGHPMDGYDLPPLHVHEHRVRLSVEAAEAAGFLFPQEAASLMERRQARRASVSDRVEQCARVVREAEEPWIVWCDLNSEAEELTAAIPGAVEVRGTMDADEKEARLVAFSEGRTRVLVTKPSIAGFGLNWQHCARVAFVGVTDSWESYYQAVRRCWRFGQARAVHVHVFASEAEGAVVANLKRKDAAGAEMARLLADETAAAVRAEVAGLIREVNEYAPTRGMEVPAWLTTEA